MRDPDSTALVGRGEALAVLYAALERVRAGEESTVVVSGETGVGKSRLVGALTARDDVSVLAGSCIPVAGQTLPLAPLTQALRGLASRRHLDRLPDLARLLPGSPVATDQDGGAGPFPQLRLFQSVLALCQAMSAEQVVVQLVEDVHWADRSTLDLLRYLATNLAGERVLTVITYRSDEISTASTLHAWLAELRRLPSTRRLHLKRLTAADTAALAQAQLGDAADADVVARIVERSAGNPLFVEHLVRHARELGPSVGTRWLDGRTRLPDTLHDLLRARVAALPEDTQRVIRAASVVGRGAVVPLLAEILGEDPVTVEDRLRPAVHQHVMIFDAGDAVTFGHPAFAEVVYAELLPGERTRLHRAVAQALAQGPSETGSPGEVARHWQEAGETARALKDSIVAGLAAERGHAVAEAHANFTRAVQLLDTLGERAPDDVDRVDLLARTAQAASLIGEDEEAVLLTQAALAVVADDRRKASLLERLGTFQFMAGRGPQAERALQEALQLIPAEEKTLAAQAHSTLALLAAAWSNLDQAQTEAALALDAARAVSARVEEGRALNALGMVAAGRGRLDEAIDHARRALEIARTVGAAFDLSAAYINLSHLFGLAGRVDEQLELCRTGTAELTRMGLMRQSGSMLMANAADSLVKAGRLQEADQLMRRALALRPRGIMAAPVLMIAGRLALVRGQLDLARERCEQARAVIEAEDAPPAWLREVTETAADVQLWQGRPAAALDAVMDRLEQLAGTDEQASGALLGVLGLRALADLAEAHRDEASRRDRHARRADLLRLTGWHPDQVATPGSADASRGASGGELAGEITALAASWRAELARADQRSDPALWAQAHRAWHELGRPFPATYCRWREAEARLGAGADADGVAALRSAFDAAAALWATKLIDEIKTLARWYRIDLVPKEVADRTRAPDREDPLKALGLTPRELEVLGALAAGRSNQEIARELFISVKTASVHVSNILRKLDVPARQDAARVAHRHGIRN